MYAHKDPVQFTKEPHKSVKEPHISAKEPYPPKKLLGCGFSTPVPEVLSLFVPLWGGCD